MSQELVSMSAKRQQTMTTTGDTRGNRYDILNLYLPLIGKDVPEKVLELPIKPQESENEQDDLDLSFLDTLDESSYLEFSRDRNCYC